MTKKLAKIFGAVFILVGILGFIPNPIVGANGFFHTNLVHDLVHVLLGLALLLMSKTGEQAAKWLKIIGVVYLLVAVLGFLMMPAMDTTTSLLGLVAINGADNWLHIVLAFVLIVSGYASKGDSAPMA